MNTVNWLHEVLKDNHYPGRGVLWGRTGDGDLLGAYFLTGRSPASQARALHLTRRSLPLASPSSPTAVTAVGPGSAPRGTAPGDARPQTG